MRQLVYKDFCTIYQVTFYLWRIEPVLKLWINHKSYIHDSSWKTIFLPIISLLFYLFNMHAHKHTHAYTHTHTHTHIHSGYYIFGKGNLSRKKHRNKAKAKKLCKILLVPFITWLPSNMSHHDEKWLLYDFYDNIIDKSFAEISDWIKSIIKYNKN